jgi:anti-anti-sigma factor
MEPLQDTLDLAAVAGASWDSAQDTHSEERICHTDRTQALSTFVVSLPRQVTEKEVRGLARDFKHVFATDQPWIILDLSEVEEMDTAGLDLLLRCLAETLRRDGTISLRGISPEASTILELTGVDRVLSMFSVSGSGASSESGHVAAALEDRTPKQLAA